ncbi:hypothetical protein TanjilG_03411 [Lupinus angustifolius]|uniref:Mei2-like C-terminal RNA recognition motif domain-containing protein n=1 Tax=Lupinus angustifolius TaxID=3871 RepID=A0A4P1RDS9_LUPAN|nr:hypothetical protein TanjilG_03411 [Lupinus angustifolius]
MAPLNPDAPKFIPSGHKLLHQPFTLPCSPLSTPFPHQHCYFPFSSHQLLYHPKLFTRVLPFSSFPLYHHHDDTNITTKQLISTTTQKAEEEPTGPYLSDIEPAIIQEAGLVHQKEETKEGYYGLKGHALKGMKRDHRGFRHKKEKDVVEYQKCWPSKNKQNCGRGAYKYSKAFHIKNRYYSSITPVRVDGEETTVMIRNIPNKYTRDSLVDYLEKLCMLENHKAEDNEGDGSGKDRIILAFDFVYLPIDFKSGLNKGYAFVNFTSPKGAWKFNMTASNMKWELFQSHKIRKVVAARLQGKEALQKHFEMGVENKGQLGGSDFSILDKFELKVAE